MGLQIVNSKTNTFYNQKRENFEYIFPASSNDEECGRSNFDIGSLMTALHEITIYNLSSQLVKEKGQRLEVHLN